jgi:hypothetical protein
LNHIDNDVAHVVFSCEGRIRTVHVLFVILGCIVIFAFLIGDYRQRDAKARAEGVMPLSKSQLRQMRRAANGGKPYTPRRRAYGSPMPLPPPYNRKK